MTAALTAATCYGGTCPGCKTWRTYTPLPGGTAPRLPEMNVTCGDCGARVTLAAGAAPPADADPFRGYLAGLVRVDIRKQRAKVARFAAKPGQDPAEAAGVLAGIRAKVDLAEGAYRALGGDPARITPAMRGGAS